jgi:starch phosphorylase
MKDSKLFRKWKVFNKAYNTEAIQCDFAEHLEYSLSKDKYTATFHDLYMALAFTVKDRLTEQWINTQQVYHDTDAKRVYYLSAEYLMGRSLINNLINLGIYRQTREAMKELNLDLDELCEQEPDAGLGNGGLGRLAACFMDSLATLEIPAHGYGIRYEFGIFEQVIRNLEQVELPDRWLKFGNPWEIARPECTFTVHFYGMVKKTEWPDGNPKFEWVDTNDVIGIAYDTPIAGYDNKTVNTLRLWSARASTEFDLDYFQHGDYFKAVEEKNISENISKVLYPNDNTFKGQVLRLKQEYFFVSCSIQDIIRRYLSEHHNFDHFSEKVVIQMNDTHPSLAIVELMRILIDDHHLGWERAWDITNSCCAYTNHTILSEALEKWPLSIFGSLLPRHLQIIYEINRRFLRDVSLRYINDFDRLNRMSLIEEGKEKKIRMANLAIVSSHRVNGVSSLHTKLLKEEIFKDFDEMFPDKIINKTNGITPRRWLLQANPALAELITEKIGREWIKDLHELKEIESLAEDKDFQDQFNRIKRTNKEQLARTTDDLTGVIIDPDSIFDVQIKRIHEYKRQLLNILHVVYCWLRLKEDNQFDMHPRTFIFAGKTAPDYYISKMIIRLICHVAEMINGDRFTNKRINVVFLPNYSVTLAERIIPAADVSEQISLAGYEASGTGNMKLALNGAITIGTRDGANIEIMEEVGEENIFLFGLSTREVKELRKTYQPADYYKKDPLLEKVIELISSGFFSPETPDLFQNLMRLLTMRDPYMVLADMESYIKCQEDVGETYRNRQLWTRKAIINTARMGKFSSDNTIREYNRDIWGAESVPVTSDENSGNGEKSKPAKQKAGIPQS